MKHPDLDPTSPSHILAVCAQYGAGQTWACSSEKKNFLQVICNPKRSFKVRLNQREHLISPRLCVVIRNTDKEISKVVSNNSCVLLFGKSSTKTVSEGIKELTPLLKELLNFVSAQGLLTSQRREHLNVYKLIMHLLSGVQEKSIAVPVPKDERLNKLYHLLTKEKAYEASLGSLAQQVGASGRTVERLIRHECNMTFSQWRQLMRLQTALQLLEQGRSVTEVSAEVGYKSSSAFISAFKEHMGLSPKKYFKK